MPADLNELFTFVVALLRPDWICDASAAGGTDSMRGLGIALLALTVGTQTTPTPRIEVAGAWVLNRELTTIPQPGEIGRGQGGRREGGGGGFGGPGGGGRGGFGGGLGRPGGIGGGMGRPSDDDMRKMEVVRRRLTEVPERLIIVHEAESVSITDGNGRRMNYKTNGKKQDQLTGDGEFTTRTHFEGTRLVVEEDFGGRKITTTYTPTMESETLRLEVTVKPEGGRGFGEERRAPGGSRSTSGDRPDGASREFKRVYDLEARGQLF
jgi:hypothetical protein